MPNLAGLHDPNAGPDDLSRGLARQLSRLRHARFTYREARLQAGPLAAALLDRELFATGPQPARNAAGRRSLLLDGEIFNLQDLARHARLPLVAGEADVDLLQRLLDRLGETLFAALNGFFVLVLFDHEDGALTIVSDRFGFRPLFFAQDGSRFVFGTELKAVRAGLRSAARLDRDGVLQLLTMGSHVGSRTWLQGCERIAPATILRVDASGLHRRQYWKYAYDEAAAPLDQATYVTNVAKLLDRAVERQMRGPARVGVFLSGGYDSRALAAAIRPQHLPLPSFTFGRPESRDAKIAPLLASRLGLRHAMLGDHPGYLYDHCRAIAWRTEGLLPFHRTTSMQHHERLGQEADVFLLGFLGELSGSHTWPALILARSREQALRTVFDRVTSARAPLAQRVLRPAVHAAALETLRGEFARMFDDVDNDQPMNLADAWRLRFLHPRTSYQATAVDRYRFEVRAPHIDPELVEFQLRIPVWARLEQRIYKKVIASSYPAIRDVPCTNNMRPIDPLFAREYARMVVDFALRKGRGLIEKFSGPRDGMGREITDYAADFRNEVRLRSEILEPLLAQGIFDPDVFDVAQVRAIIDEHYSGRARHEEMIGTLVGLGLALRYILAEDAAELPEDFRPA